MAFCEEPVLQDFDITKPIKFETDASRDAIEGVLCQRVADMNWYPVAYYSRIMLPAERSYKTYDIKLLDIVGAFKI